MTEQHVDGKAKTVRELLSGSKYAIDYYQREYKWETKQVSELITDLTNEFLDSYEVGQERSAVEKYGHYFLGSIIISNRNGQRFIIDGQQRLTTLTLLLMYLHHNLADDEDRGQVADLIFSQKYGKRSFNLEVEERTPCMEALYSGQPFDEIGRPESVRNIVRRYADIEDLFPEEAAGAALPHFKDWLIENVHLVEIVAYSDEDAYTIFETMNDRGLSLSPTDMLKGYLLANITDETAKLNANHTWKGHIAKLLDLGKDEDADCLKSWLRSQYANSIRERKKGAKPQAFDRIASEFHRWVRESSDDLGLKQSGDFARFIQRDFDFYARQYRRLREAARKLTAGMETVFYNAQHNFTLQYPVLLAPLRPDDQASEIERKIRIVGSFLDILIARRIWNWRAIDYNTVQYALFLVMRDIRGKSAAETADILKGKLDAEEVSFASNPGFRLHGMNRRQIHQLLARMTDFIETGSGLPSRFAEYVEPAGKKGYEVEHIWADHPERHQDEFSHPTDFEPYRNRFGGLLLLPKSFNASYGDKPYEEKLPHYYGQNLLAKSLNEQCYQHNPGFLRFIAQTGLPFKPHPAFNKADLDARQALYQQLAELIWDADRLSAELAA